MAIHPDFPGLKAEVVVDGVPLKEYDEDEDRQTGVLTKYVEVTSDANFAVRYTIPKSLTGPSGTRSALTIDGKAIERKNHMKSTRETWDRSHTFYRAASEVDGMLYTQKFRFSALNIDEDNRQFDENVTRQLRKVGCVTLVFKDIDGLTKRPPSNRTHRQPTQPRPSAGTSRHSELPEFEKIAEKNLKGSAKSHHAKLDAPQLKGPSHSGGSGLICRYGEVFATFHFKYRSTSALKSLYIIRPTPEPIAPPATAPQRDLGDMSREELLAVVIKRRENNEEPAPKEVKEEAVKGLKREANPDRSVFEADVEFVSRKRVNRRKGQEDGKQKLHDSIAKQDEMSDLQTETYVN